MTQWENKSFTYYLPVSEGDSRSTYLSKKNHFEMLHLDEFGREGWEVSGIRQQDEDTIFYLKRPIELPELTPKP